VAAMAATKKGQGKKSKKTFYPCGYDAHGGSGFLITFFIFTATMSTPKAMNLLMPKDVNDPKNQNEAKESGALTIMLGKGNQVYYYFGQLKVDATGNNFQQTTFKGIRQIIIDKRKEVMGRHVHDLSDADSRCKDMQELAKKKGDPDWQNACLDKDFVVIIKPDPDSNYKNMVDILDEMTINQVKTYAIVKILDQEYDLIKTTEERNGIK
jgi:biopolymer transport protein ExbD